MERIRYYIELFATFCGADSAANVSIAGVLVVLLALITLIYAFYKAVYVSIWPGEVTADHIKRRILFEDDRNEN